MPPAISSLATRAPVMDVGGFNGTDPAPTPAAFKEYVAQRKIHYFIAWVEANFTARQIDGVTVHDLTGNSA